MTETTLHPLTVHTLGFPRIGRDRELKAALESYWKGESSLDDLQEVGRHLRRAHWQAQAERGVTLLPAGDFAWYDHMLAHSLMLDAVPERFAGTLGSDGQPTFDTLFAMARGVLGDSQHGTQALEMTKWFDTNYHYLVPELQEDQEFRVAWEQLFQEVAEAKAQGHHVKPVLVGPVTYLWLSKMRGAQEVDRLSLLPRLLPVYREILQRLGDLGAEWVQLDEPILSLDLPAEWQEALRQAYAELQGAGPKVLLANYFGPLAENLPLALNLPVDGLHLDLVRGAADLAPALAAWPEGRVLSAGAVNGRNVWRSDFGAVLERLGSAYERLGKNLWLAPSCSLLHVPVDLERETELDADLKPSLAFALQKCEELAALARLLPAPTADRADEIKRQQAQRLSWRHSGKQARPGVQERVRELDTGRAVRQTPLRERQVLQHTRFGLPLYPTTTIGSMPQTREIRSARAAHKSGRLDAAGYADAMRGEIRRAVEFQEELGLDVLVHGEAERNDMVEYFAALLDGYAFSSYGWVQSYGSRCVKPPLIVGDLARPAPMTVAWATYAQSLTERPMKGMLTGPVTMLMWSFPREDISPKEQALQLALALRDEVSDLESAGIGIIQIDEAAFREGLPLRRSDWAHYLDWAVQAFRVCSGAVEPQTQIHTHMCYSEFNDIIDAIMAMDADVITIETSRSQMELLDAFNARHYASEIGPGVYDIHSPRVPDVQEMVNLMHQAAQRIPREQLWVNPDCGLKTRGWPETRAALVNMVAAAEQLRAEAQAEA